MFGKTTMCPACNKEIKVKDPKFCPACGKAIAGSHADIVMIVDRSGSMACCHESTITGFNRFLADQKAVPGVASMTVVQFDNQYETLFHRKPLGEISPVNSSAFTPRGATALLDAIGQTLATMEAEAGDRCLVCIITDGHENASKESTLQQIKDMIRRLESKGWSFIYLGANQDAFSVGTSMGILHAVNYNSTPIGTEHAYAAISCNAINYRSGGQDALNAGFDDANAALTNS